MVDWFHDPYLVDGIHMVNECPVLTLSVSHHSLEIEANKLGNYRGYIKIDMVTKLWAWVVAVIHSAPGLAAPPNRLQIEQCTS